MAFPKFQNNSTNIYERERTLGAIHLILTQILSCKIGDYTQFYNYHVISTCEKKNFSEDLKIYCNLNLFFVDCLSSACAGLVGLE